MSKSPKALIILDGFGLREETHGNAVAQAKSLTLTVTGMNSLMQLCVPMVKQLVFLTAKWATQKLVI